MEIAKFPPQHRNKCYCQTKREYGHNNGIKGDTNELSKRKTYFVKVRNTHPNSAEHQRSAQRFVKSKSHHGTTSSKSSPMQSFPNQLNTMCCNHGTNPISRNTSQSQTSHSDLHHANTYQGNNFQSNVTNNIPNSKLFNVIYDPYDKLREIKTFRAENANECISVLNQQTNHHRVPNKFAVKHVCQHRYRYLIEPTGSNGRGESQCDLCEKWCGLDRLKNVVASGNCYIVDKSDSSNLLIDDGNDCKVILEVQNMNISTDPKTTKSKQQRKKTVNRSWHLMEQAKSLALNQQRRY